MNKKKMIKGGLLGMLVGFILGWIIGGIFLFGILGVSDNVFTVFFLSTWILTTALFAWRGAKTKTNGGIELQQQNFEALSKKEKLIVWVFCVANPVITGGVLYYLWHKNYPTKAKQTNRISIIVFILEVMVAFLFL